MVDTEAKDWLNGLLTGVISIAREAGKAILKVYAEVDPAVEYKRDNSPLTQADLVSHQIIVDGLAGLSPEWPVLSEESREIPFGQRRQWGYFWLVDPLDGTKEFLKRNGEFTVNIALIEDGAPILGVVYAPAIDKLYYGARGAGAFKEESGIVSPIRTATTEAGTIRVVMSRSHGSGKRAWSDLPAERSVNLCPWEARSSFAWWRKALPMSIRAPDRRWSGIQRRPNAW